MAVTLTHSNTVTTGDSSPQPAGCRICAFTIKKGNAAQFDWSSKACWRGPFGYRSLRTEAGRSQQHLPPKLAEILPNVQATVALVTDQAYDIKMEYSGNLGGLISVTVSDTSNHCISNPHLCGFPRLHQHWLAADGRDAHDLYWTHDHHHSGNGH